MMATIGITIDRACCDVRRLCFVSSDPDVYYNADAPAMVLPVFPPRAEVVHSDTAVNMTDLMSALAAVSSDDRATWISVGQALKTLPDDQGWELYDNWSKRSAKYDARDCERVWRGFKGARTNVRSVFNIAAAHGWQNPGRSIDTAGVFGAGGSVLMTGDVRDGTTSTRPLTELGNAYRLAESHAANLRYIYDVDAWLHWDSDVWLWDTDAAKVRVLAHRLPDQIYNEGAQFIQHAEFFAKWSRTSQNAHTINAAISILSDLPGIRMPITNIDADSFTVGIDGARQLIDLKSGQIRYASQTDYVTKSLAVDTVGDASKAERWLEFLNQIFNNDVEIINWIQRWCGYLLTGDTSEHCFMFCFGHGANGKSVFADTLRHIMGDYSRAISSETLTETRRQAGGATPDLAELIGARLAICSETEDGAALAESLVKSLVAGDTISVRKLYSAPTQATPQFKLMMLGNHKPIIRGNDHGMWRRVRLLPFTRTFNEQERDPSLSGKLKAEAEHILAWMLDGCLAWQSRGLSDTPAVIKVATGEYKEEQDVIGAWIQERCKVGPNEEAHSGLLYTNYQSWSLENGLKPNSNIAFGRRLGERGFNRRKSSSLVVWTGISLGFG